MVMDLALTIFISMAMFAIGILGVLAKRNALVFFLSIELMLNAGNLLFVAFAQRWGNEIGLAWVFFVLVVAAAEAAVGLAIIINLFRSKQVVDVDQYNSLRG
jgi:NADH-quinone oxidoreductase subunit K